MVLLQLWKVCGQHPSIGKETKLFRKTLSKRHQTFAEIIFPRQYLRPRKMIDFLPLVHFIKQFLLDMTVRPTKVEIHIDNLLAYLNPLHLLRHQLHHRILSFFISSLIHSTLITTLGNGFRLNSICLSDFFFSYYLHSLA